MTSNGKYIDIRNSGFEYSFSLISKLINIFILTQFHILSKELNFYINVKFIIKVCVMNCNIYICPINIKTFKQTGLICK